MNYFSALQVEKGRDIEVAKDRFGCQSNGVVQ